MNLLIFRQARYNFNKMAQGCQYRLLYIWQIAPVKISGRFFGDFDECINHNICAGEIVILKAFNAVNIPSLVTHVKLCIFTSEMGFIA